MAGIYIHIPFCKSRCSYCDFFSSTNLQDKNKLIDALIHEIEIRNNYLEKEQIETIYFGGGTPSFIDVDEIDKILKSLFQNFRISENAEITIEANPDDLSKLKLYNFKSAGINRLSIGIQSFDDRILNFLNRRHNSDQAKQSVIEARNQGFKNISIDLIYGIPGQSFLTWKENIAKAIQLDIQHISAYHLSYENGTEIYKNLKEKKIKEIPDKESLLQYNYLVEELKKNKFFQYEISNYAKPGYESKHNTSYWNDLNYLGIGPSAHSFNGTSRQWNIASIEKYVEKMKGNMPYFEFENLNETDRINEFLITRLRTIEGLDTMKFISEFGEEKLDKLLEKAKDYLKNGNMQFSDNLLRINQSSLFTSDRILVDLFFD